MCYGDLLKMQTVANPPAKGENDSIGAASEALFLTLLSKKEQELNKQHKKSVYKFSW